MCCAGIGKTTLANELCMRWARDGFLAEDFDAIILIPLRSFQQGSLEDIIMKHIGEDNYQQLMKSAGSRCLIILEGLDEMADDRRQNDPFLIRLIKEYTILEIATILITSPPHACEDINADRIVEVVGFGKDKIRDFVEKSFPNDTQSVKKFLRKLDEYPQLHGLCYIPMYLVMLVDIFQCSAKELPFTVTELYQVIIVMILKRHVKKNVERKPTVYSSVTVRTTSSVEDTLCVMLKGIPKETIGIVFCLSRLAYRSFFDCYHHRDGKYEPKFIFSMEDLIQCGIEVTSEFDGLGLLKLEMVTRLLSTESTFSFSHSSIQEFLCSIYFCLLSEQEQTCSIDDLVHYNRIWEFCLDLAPSSLMNCMLWL